MRSPQPETLLWVPVQAVYRGQKASLVCLGLRATGGSLTASFPLVPHRSAVPGSGVLQLCHTPSPSCQVWERFRTGSSSLGAARRRPWGCPETGALLLGLAAFLELVWSISRQWLSGPCCFSNLRAVVIGPSIRAQTELGLRGHGLSSFCRWHSMLWIAALIMITGTSRSDRYLPSTAGHA